MGKADVDYSLGRYNRWYVFANVDTPIKPKDPNTPQALGVYTNGPVELILTDPQGRRTGFDPISNTSFQDIPASAYSTIIFRDEQNFSPDDPPFKALDMANQMAGQYTLDVIGTGSGDFTVEVIASDAAGNWIIQTYSGTTAPGAPSRFTFPGAVIVFAPFSARLEINSASQAFELNSTFTLGPGGTISPVTQPVTLQLGNAFLVTIPAGSLMPGPNGMFLFDGVINNVALSANLTPISANSYAFRISGAGVPNLPGANPVDVGLAIGNNGGSISVNADLR